MMTVRLDHLQCFQHQCEPAQGLQVFSEFLTIPSDSSRASLGFGETCMRAGESLDDVVGTPSNDR